MEVEFAYFCFFAGIGRCSLREDEHNDVRSFAIYFGWVQWLGCARYDIWLAGEWDGPEGVDCLQIKHLKWRAHNIRRPNWTNYDVNDAGQVVLFCGGDNCAETTDMLTGMSEFEGFEFVRINCEADGNKEVGRPRLHMNLPINLGEATSSRRSRRPMNLCAQIQNISLTVCHSCWDLQILTIDSALLANA
jgi:hypothetical protein